MIHESEHDIEKCSLVKCWSAHQEQGGPSPGEEGALAHGSVVECPLVWMEVSSPNAVKGGWARPERPHDQYVGRHLPF